jgi:uncharacterized protein
MSARSADLHRAKLMIAQLPGLAILLALGGIIYALILILGTNWKLRHPPRRTYAAALARNLPSDPSELETPLAYESWTFRSRNFDLPVWDITGLNAQGPVIILTPGWGDSRIGALVRTPYLAEHASRIIAWDMLGHGEAPGTSTLGIREPQDLCALIEHLACPVVLFGWSLGAGVSIVAATDPNTSSQVRAVIAEAPYRYPETPARNVLKAAHLPSGFSLTGAMWTLGLTGKGRREFDRCAHAARLSCPLLVIHGEYDTVCPAEDGRAIADAAPNGTYVQIDSGDHNRLWTDPGMLEQVTIATETFLAPLETYHHTDEHTPV